MAASDYSIVGEGPMCPKATLGASLDHLGGIITLTNIEALGTTPVVVGAALMIEDEILSISVIDAGVVHVLRGCADTIPAAHASGTTVWFIDDHVGSDLKDYGAGLTIGVKVLPFTTSGGSVPIGNSPPNALPLNFRFAAPYPPARMEVNAFPWFSTDPWLLDDTHGAITLRWNTRNRILQGDQLIDHLDPPVAAEVNQLTRISVYNAADDSLLRQVATDTNVFSYDRTTATLDFGVGDIPSPPDQNGYLIVDSIRDDIASYYSYRINFLLSPGSLVEQPYGLGYRLGEVLGGQVSGGVEDTRIYNAHFIAELDGKVAVIGSSSTSDTTYDLYLSEDDGATFELFKENLADTNVYGFNSSSGVAHWEGQLGTQYVSVGLNRLAFVQGLYVGDSTDLATEPTYVDGAPVTAAAEAIHCGWFGKIGSYYYIVGRYAADNDANTNLGKFYLFRATDDLQFVEQGEMTQLSTDPNKLPSGTRGEFTSWWFTPNGSPGSIYESRCELYRGYNNRWFLLNGTQLYYTDVSTGLTGWRRAPIPYPGGDFNIAKYLRVVLKPTTPHIFAMYRFQEGFRWSTTNGTSWTEQSVAVTNFDEFDQLVFGPFLKGSEWVVYANRFFRVGPGYYKEFVGKTSTPTLVGAPVNQVTGIEPADQQTTNLANVEHVSASYMLGRDQLGRWVYSANCVDFAYAQVVTLGTLLLMNFTTDASDETGRHTPQLFNDAAVGSGVVQFSGDGYVRIDQFHNDLAFGSADWTVEMFAQVDTNTGVPVANQWIYVYGDTPSERSSAALSLMAYGNTADDQLGYLVRVQTRNSSGVITTHSIGDVGMIASTDTLYHLVVQRRGTAIEFYYDGSLIDTATIASANDTFGRVTGAGKPVFLGGGPEVGGTGTGSDNPLTGSISAVRVTAGTAVYPTSGFTVPSLPLT